MTMNQRSLESPEIYRNMGFWNEGTQEALLDATVAIGGVGGTGFVAGMELARLGVQNFVVADPEDFSDSNSNRVPGVSIATIGMNKAEVFRDQVMSTNPAAKVRIYTEGINEDNIEDFLQGVDVALDATELSMPNLATMLCREARRKEIPVMNGEYVAHAGQVTSFDPHSKMTFEKFMGIKGGESAPLDEVAEQTISTSRYLAYIPPYGDIATLKAIQEGAPLPSNAIGAGVAAQLIATEALKHIRVAAGEKTLRPVFAPRVRWYDAYTGEAGTTSHPRLAHYRGLANVVARNMLHLHEEASYTTEQRAARGDVD